MGRITELKVSGTTHPNKLGGAIVKYLKEVPEICLTAMGDRPVNNAVKGLIVAQSYVAYEAKKLDIRIGFKNRHDGQKNKEVTIIVFYVTLS